LWQISFLEYVMPIVSGEILFRLSGGAANSNPDASLGGAKSSVAMPSGLFDTVSGAESAAGDVEYRCFYVHNSNASLVMQGAKVWIQANTAGSEIAIGVGSAAINAVEQTVANESTAPSAVTFSQPANLAAGLALGDIPAGQHKAVWVRRTIAASAAASAKTYQLAVGCDTAA
jgi:hypothetical protein